MKGKGPMLSERRGKRSINAQQNTPEIAAPAGAQQTPAALVQQLASNPLFKQFQDQPDKLLAVLQHDQVLAEAAAGNPEIAALLDPSTLKQALAVLQGAGSSSDPQQQQQQQQGAPVLQRKALMQLQNYAQQLQQARLAGLGPPPITLSHQQQQQQQQQQAQANSTPSVGLVQSAAAAADINHMWAAMQERFSKLQQRSSMLSAMPEMQQGSPHLPDPQQQQQPGGQVQHLPTPWLSTQLQQQQVQHMQQQQTQHCQQPRAQQQQQPTQQPQAQHSRFRDAASRSLLQQQGGSSSSMGSPGCSPKVSNSGVRLARLALPDRWGGSSSSSGRVMSPLARVTSPSGSGPCLSPGSLDVLQRRSSSSLSHRLLRHSAASPLDLATDLQRSGSQALCVEQLKSGDMIVDITPPTRVTQELAWSTDPTAAYVLEAADSGNFGQSAASDSSHTHLPVSTLTATDSTPSGANLASAAAAGAAGLTGPAPAGAFGGFGGAAGLQGSSASEPQQQQQQQQLYALPLLGGGEGPPLNSSSHSTQAAAAAQVGTDSGSVAAAAAASTAASSKRSGNGSRQRTSPQKLQLRVATPVQTSRQQQGTAQAQKQQQQQRDQLQEEHYSYVDLTEGTATVLPAASDGSSNAQWQHQQQQQQQQNYQQPFNHQQQQQQQPGNSSWHESAAATALAGARAAAAAGGSLDARTYYESVPPSAWRAPTDVGGAPGDYLELYRRAYCSYADALFPPLWMGLVACLATLQLLPLWQLCLLAVAAFWGGLWLMAIKWAGVPPKQLGLSRVTPMLTVCLELMCTGAFVTQVLPVMWLGHSLVCMVLLLSCLGMLSLHLTAYLQDPGYTPLPQADAEQGLFARHLDAAASSKTSKPRAAADSNAVSKGAAAAAAAASEAAAEQTPLLGSTGQQQQQQTVQAGSGTAGPVAWQGQPMDHCWTCRVKRNLRSKHCPLCRRCVERFDHHCPVLGNCVGAGNHKTFVAFLALMLLSQLLFCQVVSSMLTQTYLLQLAAPHSLTAASGLHAASSKLAGASSSSTAGAVTASQGAAAGAAGAAAAVAAGEQGTPGAVSAVDTAAEVQGKPAASQGGMRLTLQALWAAGSTHMGLLLLLLAQVPTMFMSGLLLFRALGLAAANLTVNEWMNRARYVHLHYTGAGFSNRFDRGVAANCYDFLCGPKFVDYWAAWDAAEQEMQRKGMTVLVAWSPTVLVRFWDVRWAKYQERLLKIRERRMELRMQRRMQAVGLPAHN